MALEFLKKLIPSHTIPAINFERAVFESLKRVMTGKESVQEELGAIERLYAAPPEDHTREAQAAALYIKLEQYVSQDQPRNRISRENLRERIGRECNAVHAEGVFSLLFLPKYLRDMRLLEQFADQVIAKAGTIYGEDILVELCKASFGKEPYFRETLERYWVHWRRLERKMQALKLLPETQEKTLKELFGSGMLTFYNLCVERNGIGLTDQLFADAYREFRSRFSFMEEAPQVLSILPMGLLDDEKLALTPKSELEETVRQNTAALEVALSELQLERSRLKEALDQLKKVDMAKSDFITVVSHQFRTPLSVIRWNTEVLGTRITDSLPKIASREMTQMVSLIEEKVVFLANMLEDIYDVLAVERENVIVDKKPAQLWELAHDTMKKFEKEARRRGVRLAFSQTMPVLEELSIDSHKIARVCDILIRNAVQYTAEGGEITIGVTKENDGGHEALKCTVTDTGIGIESGDLPKIFTKFFRGKNAVSMVPDGAGVGLYLAKAFVTAHGGILSVSSEPGKGSSFSFGLPLK